MQAAAAILADVRAEGDVAVRRYCERFDGGAPANLLATKAQIAGLAAGAAPALRVALATAIRNIRAFHARQTQADWSFPRSPGVMLGMRVRPLDAVGVYVPGGKAAYPSTVAMNIVPAQVAGVRRIAVATPAPSFFANPAIACALDMLGVSEVYLAGGAQAIGALAFGTASLPRVDKIVGPGNAYVAAAKRQVFGHVAIDSIAGPSEVVVIADASANPAWIAADLLSQAEHDEAASAIAVTWEEAVAEAVATEVSRQLPGLARAAIAAESLARYGAVVLVADAAAALDLIARLAPEHVELMVADPAGMAARVGPAGALFLGPYTAEVVGDYLAGPNHVLPTHGTARFASPLGVYDFQVRGSILQYDREAFLAEAEIIATLADAEGLGAHAAAARIRIAGEARGGAGQVDPVAFVKPAVRSLAAYHLEPHRAPVKLNQNENPHDLPDDIKREVLARLAERPWCRYPDFVPAALRSALAAHVGWGADGILVGNGSNELIQALLAVAVAPGTRVATLDPTFSLYGLLVGVFGGRLHKVPLRADLAFDMPALAGAVEEADVTIVCSPNNPTGRQLPRADLLALLARARGLVVLDEAYVEFAPDCLTDLVPRFRNLVVLRTFSKALAMAGLRVGYLVGDPALVAEIAKAKLPYNLNVFSTTAAEVALERIDRLQAAIATLKAERERMAAALGALPGFQPQPTDANFMLVETDRDPRQVFEALLARGVLVRDVSAHPALSRYFRCNVGTPDENDRFLDALALAGNAPGLA